ncbi:MAG TPA: polysaccharide pyruvyl transferase family protein, partial [Caulobacteraceae bacterium]|nr:polysaccharide pyruvyl transferase family protein [Caulobacteraceae bacterium]
MAKSYKIGVLTFHRCINYGSYWQARCLVEGLRRRGHDAVLLDHHSRTVDRAEWKCAFRPTLPTRPPREDYPLYAAKARRFFEAFAALPLSAPFALEDPAAMEPVDLAVVGSDEVWNLRHPWYAGYPLFFGDGLKAGRVVSYAASFGNHDAAEAIGEPWARRLERFAAIGVRDENSRDLVRRAVARDPALVLDPCLQFSRVCRRTAGAAAAGEVLVYGHSFPDWFVETVRKWAHARRLRLVSLGYRNDWADEQRLAAGPEEFAQAMADAGAVVTNFFHGCVFALVNQKPFVCVRRAKTQPWKKLVTTAPASAMA